MTHRTVEGSPESGSRITPDAPASPAPPQGEREACDVAFAAWYDTQAHQLSNEQVCRVIWRRAWETSRASTQPAVSAEARIEQPDVHSASGDLLGSYDATVWVPVSERLPQVGTECLVFKTSPFADGPYIAIDRWDEQYEAPVSFSSATVPVGPGWGDADFEEVTHWMPLPAAPSLRSVAGAQKPNEHESGAAMGTPPADKENGNGR